MSDDVRPPGRVLRIPPGKGGCDGPGVLRPWIRLVKALSANGQVPSDEWRIRGFLCFTALSNTWLRRAWPTALLRAAPSVAACATLPRPRDSISPWGLQRTNWSPVAATERRQPEGGAAEGDPAPRHPRSQPETVQQSGVLLFCQKAPPIHFASAMWSRMMCVIEDSWRDRLGWSSAQTLASMTRIETAILQEPNA